MMIGITEQDSRKKGNGVTHQHPFWIVTISFSTTVVTLMLLVTLGANTNLHGNLPTAVLPNSQHQQQQRERSQRRRLDESPSRLHMRTGTGSNSAGGEKIPRMGGDIGPWSAKPEDIKSQPSFYSKHGNSMRSDAGEWTITVKTGNSIQTTRTVGGDAGEWAVSSNSDRKSGNSMERSHVGDAGEYALSGNQKSGNSMQQKSYGGDAGEYAIGNSQKSGNSMQQRSYGGDAGEYAISGSQKSGNSMRSYGGDAGEYAIGNSQKSGNSMQRSFGGDAGEYALSNNQKSGNSMRAYGGDAGEYAIKSANNVNTRGDDDAGGWESPKTGNHVGGTSGGRSSTNTATDTDRNRANGEPESGNEEVYGPPLPPDDFFLAIRDDSRFTIPFGIEEGAPDASFFLDTLGNAGFGTCRPQASIHVVTPSDSSPSIRLEQRSPPIIAESTTPQRETERNDSKENDSAESLVKKQAWDIIGNRGGFYIYEGQDQLRDDSQPTTEGETNQPATTYYRTLPFQIESGAPSGSLVVTENGNVGLGTDSPSDRLHVFGNARIDGDLQVGNNCYLDINTCEWQTKNKRSLRPLRRTNANDDSVVQQEWDDMQQQLLQDQETIRVLTSTVETLQQQQAELLMQFQSMQLKIQSLLQTQQ